MSDPNVHVDTHPTGQPNRTAVNAENSIFGRPADPIPEVSMQQTAVVQSEKNRRETVQSPLINEGVASPVLPSAEDLDAVASESAVKEATGSKADDWTQTKGAGLTDDTSSAKSGAEYTHSSGGDSSKITPTVPVVLPTQEEADAVVAQAKAEAEERKAEAAIVDQFKIGEKVQFTPESGNVTTEVFTIDGGERGQGHLDNALWFWRLVEKPGGLWLGSSLKPSSVHVAEG